MSARAIQYLIESGLFSSGTLKAFYDFSQPSVDINGEISYLNQPWNYADHSCVLTMSPTGDAHNYLSTGESGCLKVFGGVNFPPSGAFLTKAQIDNVSGFYTGGPFTMLFDVEMLCQKDLFGTGAITGESIGTFPTYTLFWDYSGTKIPLNYSGLDGAWNFRIWTGAGIFIYGDETGMSPRWNYSDQYDPMISPLLDFDADTPEGVWIDNILNEYLVTGVSTGAYVPQNGPMHDREIIFSNAGIDTTGDSPDFYGWEVGMTSANTLYFRTINDWDGSGIPQVKTFTFDEVRNGKNIWAVRHQGGNLSLGWFNPASRQIEEKSFNLESPLSATNDETGRGQRWYLGMSESYLSNQTILAPEVCREIEGTGVGNMKFDNFMYLNTNLTNSSLILVCEALKSNLVSGQVVTSGYQYDSNSTETCSGISGTLYTTFVFSGFTTVTTTITGAPVYTPITGLVPSGSGNLEPCEESGIFSTEYVDATGPGIIGYSITFPTAFRNETFAVWSSSGVSGEIGQNCETVVTTTGAWVYETGTSYDLTGYAWSDLYPESFTYIGGYQEGDLVESITGSTSYDLSMVIYGGVLPLINYSPSVINSTQENGKTFAMIGYTGLGSGTSFFMNGLAQRYSGDFSVTGNNNEFIVSRPFTGVDQVENMFAVVDINTGSGFHFPLYDLSGSGITHLFQGFVNGNFLWSGTDGYYSTSGTLGNWRIFYNGTWMAYTLSHYPTGDYYLVLDESTVGPWTATYSQQNLSYRTLSQDITGVSQYNGQPLTGIFPSGNQVFFNGQKLYEGVDYLGEYTFTPTGNITGQTGTYFTYPSFGAVDFTGYRSVSDGIESQTSGTMPLSTAFFINGVRVSPFLIVEHDSSKDMISKKSVIIEGLEDVGEGFIP